MKKPEKNSSTSSEREKPHEFVRVYPTMEELDALDKFIRARAPHIPFTSARDRSYARSMATREAINRLVRDYDIGQ